MQKNLITLFLCVCVKAHLMASLQSASSASASSAHSESDFPSLNPQATEQEFKRFLEDVKRELLRQKRLMKKITCELAQQEDPKKREKEERKERRKQRPNNKKK